MPDLFLAYVISPIIIFCMPIFLFAFFLYLPIYAIILKKNEPSLYDKLGGSRMFWPQSFGDIIYFFCTKKYLKSKHCGVVFHGRILTWALGYTGFAAASDFIVALVYMLIRSFLTNTSL